MPEAESYFWNTHEMRCLEMTLSCINIFPNNNSNDGQLTFCSSNRNLLCQTLCSLYMSSFSPVRKAQPSWKSYHLYFSRGTLYVHFIQKSNHTKATQLFKLGVSLRYLFSFYAMKVYTDFGLLVLGEMSPYRKFGKFHLCCLHCLYTNVCSLLTIWLLLGKKFWNWSRWICFSTSVCFSSPPTFKALFNKSLWNCYFIFTWIHTVTSFEKERKICFEPLS